MAFCALECTLSPVLQLVPLVEQGFRALERAPDAVRSAQFSANEALQLVKPLRIEVSAATAANHRTSAPQIFNAALDVPGV